MEIRYYCFLACVGRTSDFMERVQIKASKDRKYKIKKKVGRYVILHDYLGEFAVDEELFNDNFRVTRA